MPGSEYRAQAEGKQAGEADETHQESKQNHNPVPSVGYSIPRDNRTRCNHRGRYHGRLPAPTGS